MTTEPRIIPIESTDRNFNVNHGNGNSLDDPSRKPSYVGLSCAVSGYSSFIRYTSPSRKNSPPQTFRVSTEPQTLDCTNDYNLNMRNQHSVQPKRGQIESPPDTTDFYHQRKFSNNNNNCLRETSPGSDTSSVGSSSCSSMNGSGNLVQKQIERLYGAGKMATVRLTSPEPKSEDSSPEIIKDPLELKTLKVPAVFRLLRPEFREQLKNNSCQQPMDFSATPTSSRSRSSAERIIPIAVETNLNGNSKSTERIIPVVKDSKPFEGRKPDVVSSNSISEKPALPAKPMSPTNNGTHQEIKSPALVSSLQKSTKKIPEEPESDEELIEDDEEQEYPVAGMRERTLLCPIQEEDTESTASGSSVSVATKRSSSVIPNNADQESNTKVIQEEVKDGHYFIKNIENEIFKFEEQICDFEEDLSNEANDIPDDIRDSILAAIGKAKLLMSQKLAQFRGLCDKNIHSNPEEDPFVPTSEDLAGFWDMVYIQVEHIHSLFAELTEIRTNGWRKPEVKPEVKKEPVKKPKSKMANNKNGGGAKNGKNGQQKSEAAQKRDEARRKMLEEKKRQMKIKQQQQSKNENEVIFVEF